MKSFTNIIVDGEEQQAWEVYSDDTKEQTVGFIFSDDDAVKVEEMSNMINLLKECKDFICRWDDLDEGELAMNKKIEDMLKRITR